MECLIFDIGKTVLGGLAFTLILFLIKEYLLPKKNITGEWKSVLKIENSNYNLYKNLQIEFKIHLLHKGSEIVGMGEKIKDIHPDGSETVFEPSKRVKIEISGYYEKKYLRRSKVYFNILEKGRQRESLSTYILTVRNKSLLKGTFSSTAADSSGRVTMFRI